MTEREIFFEYKKIAHPHSVIWKPPQMRTMRSDIFGCFDFIEYNPAFGYKLVQITTTNHLSERRRKIQDFFNKNNLKMPNCYIYAWDKSKGYFKVEKV